MFRDQLRFNNQFIPLVVSKMGILAQTSNFQNCIKKTNKIPEYARNYKNEWLFIRGINKEFYKFEDKCELYESKFYESEYCKNLKYLMKRFLRKQEYGYLKDTTSFVFKKTDVFYIKDINELLKYENDDGFYPGFSDFYNLFCKFYDKINVGRDCINDIDFYVNRIEYHSDPRNKISDSDNECLENILDSDSDSDSD